jgi:glycosyltransferase involved in cell wall biosynthesis
MAVRDSGVPKLASIVVRSMARPELDDALASLAEQIYPRMEIVLVDATGGKHPHAPASCGPHPVRFVAGAAPRSRPVAANAGLDAASGEYIGFLDDDDRLLPGHVAGLVAALDSHPEFAVVYAHAIEVEADGSVVHVRDEPFSRALLFQDSYVMLQASMLRRELSARCRFDITFDVFEDWDFWIQASRVTDFLPVAQRTMIYRSSLGRSGIGRGANRDAAIVEAYRRRIAAKWRAEGERAMLELEEAFAAAQSAFDAGDRTRADALAADVLSRYRYHVGALMVAGTLAALRGEFALAAAHFEVAARERPDDANVRFNLAQALDRGGRSAEATSAYRQVLALAPAHPHALARLRHLGASERA